MDSARWTAALFTALGALAGAQGAQAAPILPNGNYFSNAQCLQSGRGITSNQLGVDDIVDCGAGQGARGITGGLSVFASAEGDAVAEVREVYYLEIVGPAGMIPIDVTDATGAFTYSDSPKGFPSGYPYQLVDLRIYDHAQLNAVLEGCLGGFDEECGSVAGKPQFFDLSGVYDFTANALIQINMDVIAASYYAPNGSAQSIIDPQFAIDANFSNASEYKIVYSPGFGPSQQVPEPASIGLFGVGLIWLSRRRKCRVSDTDA